MENAVEAPAAVPVLAPPATDAVATTKAQIIKQYHDAATKEKRAELVKQYPWLGQTFASINHTPDQP